MSERRACACSDFSRTELFRRAAARAGDGLPAIEPGEPTPAGTGLSRRSLLLRGAGLAVAVYGGGALSGRLFEDGVANAAVHANGNGRILVSVFLEGGIDALNVLFPAFDGRYYDLRPKLALKESDGTPFAEDPRLRWHPSAAALDTLHREGKVTVFPGIGYDHPDKSHFTSRHYWEVGATDAHLVTGWLGRFLDATGAVDNPLQGLSLDFRLQPALATARVPIASLDGPDRYAYSVPRLAAENELLEALADLGAANARTKDPALRAAAAAASQAHRLRSDLHPFDGGIKSPVPYPTANGNNADFPRRLAGLAAMIQQGLPLRAVALRAPGMFDTHSDQADELTSDLKLAADSLLAFQRDLEARGLADKVLVHVWSEFGRRAKENGSLGTDHGAAGVGFLIGSRVRGKMVGEFPGLDRLDEQGNLRATSDFRGVYSALFEQWFDADAAQIIPNASQFARPALLK
jgi:uncharacterized protein (DUF1501 family)